MEKNKAIIEIVCENPKLVLDALKPDISQIPNEEKFAIKFGTNKNKINMHIEAKDIPALLAGMNSYLRLIRSAIEVSKIE